MTLDDTPIGESDSEKLEFLITPPSNFDTESKGRPLRQPKETSTPEIDNLEEKKSDKAPSWYLKNHPWIGSKQTKEKPTTANDCVTKGDSIPLKVVAIASTQLDPTQDTSLIHCPQCFSVVPEGVLKLMRIPEFFGDIRVDKLTAEDWLKQLEELRTQTTWSFCNLTTFAQKLLKGKARDWNRATRPMRELYTWVKFKERFLMAFSPTRLLNQLAQASPDCVDSGQKSESQVRINILFDSELEYNILTKRGANKLQSRLSSLKNFPITLQKLTTMYTPAKILGRRGYILPVTSNDAFGNARTIQVPIYLTDSLLPRFPMVDCVIGHTSMHRFGYKLFHEPARFVEFKVDVVPKHDSHLLAKDAITNTSEPDMFTPFPQDQFTQVDKAVEELYHKFGKDLLDTALEIRGCGLETYDGGVTEVAPLRWTKKSVEPILDLSAIPTHGYRGRGQRKPNIPMICFTCGRPGHANYNCPNGKRSKNSGHKASLYRGVYSDHYARKANSWNKPE